MDMAEKQVTNKHFAIMAQSLPSNVHVSTHPSVLAKLSQLRSSAANSRETKALVHEIGLMVGYEAVGAGLTVTKGTEVINYFLFKEITGNTV